VRLGPLGVPAASFTFSDGRHALGRSSDVEWSQPALAGMRCMPNAIVSTQGMETERDYQAWYWKRRAKMMPELGFRSHLCAIRSARDHLRLEHPGAPWHVTRRGDRRCEIFRDDRNRRESFGRSAAAPDSDAVKWIVVRIDCLLAR
jgi:hypothetical protein